MSKRNPALDGIRGLAIILVLVWHFGPCLFIFQPAPHSLGRALYNLAIPTQAGVDLFFVLSGFLIGGILLDQRGAPNFLRVFYLRRGCRIFPLYYGWLAFYAMVVGLWPPRSPLFQQSFNAHIALWPFLIFVQNQAGDFATAFNHSGLGVTWSLAVEEQFYLLMPWLVLGLPRRALAGLMAVAIVTAPCARWYCSSPGDTIYTFCRWDALAWGVLLAMAIRDRRIWTVLVSRRGQLLWAWLAVLAVAWWQLGPGAETGVIYQSMLNLSWAGLLFFTLSAPEGRLGRLFATPWLARAGILSYAIYLFHIPMLYLVFSLQDTTVSRPLIYDRFDVLLVLVAGVLTWGLAALLHRFVERPIMAWGHRMSYAGAVDHKTAKNT